ncbi:hypothetical protein DPMN_036500 [Dreissena polymorpha]|uniref:Cadherin domain-containing protein n=1 Tax=Dreissena polymorpha TaxID=45954 RepID=A0A9D4RLZ0_DREPO|nr:hypothetical protein DPMN_036500 [Dreissena polymorpha]
MFNLAFKIPDELIPLGKEKHEIAVELSVSQYFYILATDRSWKPLSNRALVKIGVAFSNFTRTLGFAIPTQFIEVKESTAITNALLTTLNVTNTNVALRLFSTPPPRCHATLSYQKTFVYINVQDENDNAPYFVYPVYPALLNVRTYFGAIARFSMSNKAPNVIGRIILIETISYQRYILNGILSVDYKKTDVIFVVVNDGNQFNLFDAATDELNL